MDHQLVESFLRAAATIIEVLVGVCVALGIVEAVVRTASYYLRREATDDALEYVRLRLGEWLATALSFALGADILLTAVTPTWEELGQLAIVALLRTFLGFFLQKEMQHAIDRRGGRLTLASPRRPELGPAAHLDQSHE